MAEMISTPYGAVSVELLQDKRGFKCEGDACPDVKSKWGGNRKIVIRNTGDRDIEAAPFYINIGTQIIKGETLTIWPGETEKTTMPSHFIGVHRIEAKYI